MRLIVRPRATEDLRCIHRFIAADNPAAARCFVTAIRQPRTVLRDHPQAAPCGTI